MKSVLDRFEEKYIPEPMSGCWLWMGHVNPYGLFQIDGVRVGAHVASYYLLKDGPIEYGMVVRHTCDTPSCVNPDHLELGTYEQNNQDRDRRGRNYQASKTKCLNGHEFTEKNTRHYKGQRWCRRCDADRRLRYRGKGDSH